MMVGERLPQAPGAAAVRTDETGEVGAGHRLGNYEVLQRLAAGGMAEIFLARAVGVLGFDKLVVIKRVLPHLASRPDFVQMFLDEARIAATLTHANIVQTHEVGTHGKSYFMVMEYLAGEDARTIVRTVGKDERRVPLQHVLQIALGVAAGLHYAHEKRDQRGKPLHIVHRDVTPQNVIVTWDGAVKLLDFGIAKAANRLNETRSGSFKGKVPWMSPEQCRGDALDRRSDIFSLGIMLHEMSVGRRLFRGETDFQILKQIAEGPIARPRDIDRSIDPRLDGIIMKALERDPAQRFQTAREVQVALEELAHDLRLRLSPLGLADFMHATFADKINRWERAAAGDDVEKLEAHFATVMAEREADLVAEEKEPVPKVALGPASLPPVDMLPELPADALVATRRWPAFLIAAVAALVLGGGGWLLRGRLAAQATAAGATAKASGANSGAASASADPTADAKAANAEAATGTRATGTPAASAARTGELGGDELGVPGGMATATIEVTTTPPGAPRRPAPSWCSTASRATSAARPASAASSPASCTRSPFTCRGGPALPSAFSSTPAKRRRWRSTCAAPRSTAPPRSSTRLSPPRARRGRRRPSRPPAPSWRPLWRRRSSRATARSSSPRARGATSPSTGSRAAPRRSASSSRRAATRSCWPTPSSRSSARSPSTSSPDRRCARVSTSPPSKSRRSKPLPSLGRLRAASAASLLPHIPTGMLGRRSLRPQLLARPGSVRGLDHRL
jgi:hypothetical protein